MDFKMPTVTQWDSIYQQAQERFMKQLGDRPTWKSVASKTHNINKLGTLQYIAMITLLFIVIYTSFKATSIAIDFADNMVSAMVHSNANETLVSFIRTGFTLSAIIVNVFMASPAFILFKIRSEDTKFTTMMQEKHSKLSLKYWYPRINPVMVYISLLWMFSFSTIGYAEVISQGNVLYIIVDGLTRYLPVIAEVALAGEVGDILANNFKFRTVVNDRLENAINEYDRTVESMDHNKKFLAILYRVIRQSLPQLKVKVGMENRKAVYDTPNAWLEGSPELDSYVRQVFDYHLRGATEFVEYATTNEFLDTQEVYIYGGKIKPPDGKSEWTVADMVQQFRVMNLTSSDDYNRRNLDNDFASGYRAREAWASGAKEYFTGG